MGLVVFVDIKVKEKVLNDLVVNVWICCIGECIVKLVGCELLNVQWEFVVFELEQINVFVLFGGKVGVYMGFIKFVESDDEIVVVMGYEVVYVFLWYGGEWVLQ